MSWSPPLYILCKGLKAYVSRVTSTARSMQGPYPAIPETPSTGGLKIRENPSPGCHSLTRSPPPRLTHTKATDDLDRWAPVDISAVLIPTPPRTRLRTSSQKVHSKPHPSFRATLASGPPRLREDTQSPERDYLAQHSRSPFLGSLIVDPQSRPYRLGSSGTRQTGDDDHQPPKGISRKSNTLSKPTAQSRAATPAAQGLPQKLNAHRPALPYNVRDAGTPSRRSPPA